MTNQINNQSTIPSTDVIQLTLTLKMTTAQAVETSVTVNNSSPIQHYVHPDDQTQPTVDNMLGLKQAFLDYEKVILKNWKNWHFRKGVYPRF